MKDDYDERAVDATYEDEHTSRRTVTIPLKEYDELKAEQSFIKLFASYDRDDDGSLTFGDRTMIPLACVKKMTKLP